MTSSEHGFNPDIHQNEPVEKDPQEIVALKWHLLQLELIKNNLDQTNLTAEQKNHARRLLQEIQQFSEQQLDPNKETAEIGSFKALTDVWKSAQEASVKEETSFIRKFTDAAIKAGWTVEDVTHSELALLACTNEKGEKCVVFNPLHSFENNIAKFFNKTPDSPSPSGRMTNWELVEPARFHGKAHEKIDSQIQHDAITPGLLRVVKPQ